MDVSSLACFNKGYKFLLTCINVFSKFAWVVPLKNMTGESLVNGFQSILDLGRSLEQLQTDKGTEFLRDAPLFFYWGGTFFIKKIVRKL